MLVPRLLGESSDATHSWNSAEASPTSAGQPPIEKLNSRLARLGKYSEAVMASTLALMPTLDRYCATAWAIWPSLT
ncbi:Uncharacterised protein [Bordetella pertussis]|nr:Uncharacterised protein [Bordetella pertussis]